MIPDWAPKPMQWTLNPTLVEWAFQFTKDTPLLDTSEAQEHRALYVGFPRALHPPRVLIGDSFGSCRYWHGVVMNRWATDWTSIYTDGKGLMTMTNMEDHGIAAALSRLAKIGRVDFQRVLVLRAGSNFSMPPGGQSAADSMVAEYAGMLPALESAYRVGSPIVRELIQNWTQYEAAVPTP